MRATARDRALLSLSALLCAALSSRAARAEDRPERLRPSALLGPSGALAAAGGPSAPNDAAAEYPPPSTRWKVAGVGLAAAAVFYGAGAGLSYAEPDTPGMKDLRIPVAGPWIAAAHSGCAANDSCAKTAIVGRTLLFVLDGIAEAAALGVILEGLFMPTEETAAARRTEQPGPRTSPPEKSPAPSEGEKLFWAPRPLEVGSGLGVGIAGRF